MISTYTVAPFRPLPTERVVRQLWTRPSGAPVARPGYAPAADVYREGDDLVARFDLPGVDPERDVTVELEGRRLVVRGERRDQRAVESPGADDAADGEQAEGEQTDAQPEAQAEAGAAVAEAAPAGRRIREVRFGEFRRTVTLPKTAEADAVRASYDAGVLTVTVAGVFAGRAPQRIEVTRAA
ncbi:Hsp20/alpha crystallin family protein [Cellulosimicrobium protaetiae]|uniref:Hsp20/alpha crystallin family protein n=1 Tax=Cellulosimicrobium protaetiae TaxID=2587808 RepID=A0A6M5UAI9_9MICO|nr:Hsp20/alpha crystallin family protein [Cellulosimicrobium protaetiae]QJW35516.1 Hsp20/alpha crystallin family protein [Cellulosimicrobium protaetiae]